MVSSFDILKQQLQTGFFQLPSPGLSFEDYKNIHKVSLDENEAFWSAAARQLLQWDKPFTKVLEGYST